VFVQVPSVGSVVTRGASISEVESTKSVSDVYAPVSGTVVEANDALADAPQKLNEDPYGEAWIAVVEVSDPTELDALLDAATYRKLVEG
jgi:glycine cleavage system H protein